MTHAHQDTNGAEMQAEPDIWVAAGNAVTIARWAAALAASAGLVLGFAMGRFG